MKFKLSYLMYVVSAVILIVTAVYGINRFRERASKLDIVANNETEIQKLEEYKQKSLSEYELALSQNRKTQTEIKKRLDKILPAGEAFTDLTRELDSFFEKNYSQRDMFVVGTLNFSTPAEAPEGKPYKVLPFSMSIESSKENFDKFLNYIENSGTLSTMTRLLNIESISLNFGTENRITFSVNMQAFFMPQSEASEAQPSSV